ncbi:MAG TPA: hypothetical protein VL243_15255 [Vicinamibacterales bacterium]|nr:hypothetical protein [Vicinamibacterales bacterium]
MNIKLLLLIAAFGVAAACNQAPAGAPTTQDAAPGATASGTGSGAAPSGAAAPAAQPGAATSSTNPAREQPKPAAPAMMEMEVPAGTPLAIVLDTPVSSATSQVEDTVKGHVANAVDVGGMTTIPKGSQVSGTVVEAAPSGKVKGRALIALRFNRVIVANTPYTIRTARIVREAEATKGEDAKKVGIGAGAGAVIGAIAGGKKGAAIGGAVGAGAGGGAVLATKGKEVSLGSGVTVRTTIEQPVKINAPM